MFNLEQAIAEWRKKVGAAGIKNASVLDELESHLRDDVDLQMKLGVNPQQSFDTAVQTIGWGEALKAEFSKVGESAEAWERRWTFAVVVASMSIYLLLIAGTFLLSGVQFTVEQRIAGLIAGVLTPLFVFSGRYFYRFFPVFENKRARMCVEVVLGIPIIAVVIVFMNFGLPHFELMMEGVTIVVLWATVPLSVLCGLIFGLEEAAYRGSGTVKS